MPSFAINSFWTFKFHFKLNLTVKLNTNIRQSRHFKLTKLALIISLCSCWSLSLPEAKNNLAWNWVKWFQNAWKFLNKNFGNNDAQRHVKPCARLWFATFFPHFYVPMNMKLHLLCRTQSVSSTAIYINSLQAFLLSSLKGPLIHEKRKSYNKNNESDSIESSNGSEYQVRSNDIWSILV